MLQHGRDNIAHFAPAVGLMQLVAMKSKLSAAHLPQEELEELAQ